MRLSRWGQAALAVFSLVIVCLHAHPRQHESGLLEQLLVSVSRSQGVEVDTRNPDAIASTPFFQELPSQQKGQLLLQAARLQLMGDGSTAPSISTARLLLHASADEFGNPDAQFFLGALATLDEDTDDTPALSVLYQQFGARGGSVAASMALGYRHLYGYDVPKSCESALRYYKFAADRVISVQSSERPIQVFSSPQPFRLTDDASKKKPGRTDEDAHRMEYLRQKARSSSDPVLLENAASVVLFSDLPHATTTASSNSASLLFQASKPEHTHYLEAKALLDRAVSLGSFSAKALLGHVYAYGLGGFHPNVPKAIRLYEEALNESAIANQTSAEAANGLGLIYFNGVGDTRIDYERAMRLFQVSAGKGHADGVYNTGVLLSKSHPQRAREYLEASAHVGHLKAQFKLARLKEKERFSSTKHIQGPAGSASTGYRSVGSCEQIVKLYKQVAENAHEGNKLLESAAATFLFGNNWQHALNLYLVAAEMGYEVAESNAAWLIERQRKSPLLGRDSQLYQKLVRRGVAQDSPDAHVRYGDLLYAERDFALAMFQYELADYLSHGNHGRALFNMAFMHEQGLGVVSRSLETASLYYELVTSVEPALQEVVWLLRLKLKVQIQLERLVEMLWSVQSQICEVLGLPSLKYQDDAGDRDPNEGKSSSASNGVVGENSHQADLTSSPSEPQIQESVEGVKFASAMRFTAESKLQLEVLQSQQEPQSFTIDFWIKIGNDDQGDSRRTHMVLLDMQDSYRLELTRRSDNKDEWVLQFRTMSTLFVFPNAKLRGDEWDHIALVVGDAVEDSEPTISLFANGELQHQFSYHHLHESRSSSTQKILSVGSSLTRSTTPVQSSQLIGSLLHFRIWKATKTEASIRALMRTPQHELSRSDLLVQLQFQIRRDHAVQTALERTSSSLDANNTPIFAAYSIDPEIVQFPPEEVKSTKS